jgi:hypothetical protein
MLEEKYITQEKERPNGEIGQKILKSRLLHSLVAFRVFR